MENLRKEERQRRLVMKDAEDILRNILFFPVTISRQTTTRWGFFQTLIINDKNISGNWLSICDESWEGEACSLNILHVWGKKIHYHYHHHHSFIHMYRLRPAPDVSMTVLRWLTAMVPPSTDSAGKIPTIST